MMAGEIWEAKEATKISPDSPEFKIVIKLIEYLNNDVWECEVIFPKNSAAILSITGEVIYNECVKIGEA